MAVDALRTVVVGWWAEVRPAGAIRLAYEIGLTLVFSVTALVGPVVWEGGVLPPAVGAVVAVVTAAVAVPLRLVHPLTALLCAAAVGVLVGDAGGVLTVLLCFSVGYRLRHLGRTILALLATAGCWLAAVLLIEETNDAAGLLLAAAFFVPSHVLPTVVGWAVGRRRRVVGAMHWRNVQLHDQQLSVARQARTRERNRIARDLHDSLGHRLTLISLYAGTLNSATGAQRDENVALLRSTAVDAMVDLRQILGVLGQEEEGDEVGVAQPLENLDALLASTRSAGAACTLTRSGAARTLPPLIEHAAYRVVQEGLTNALRHARGAPIEVTLRYEPDMLAVEVCNGSGQAYPSPTSGLGLIGLGERVRLAGGVLHHAATAGHGFRLAAMLPYRVETAQSTVGPGSYSVPSPVAVPGVDAAGDFDQLVRRSARRSRVVLIAATAVVVAMLGICGAAVVLVAVAPPTTVSAEQFAAFRVGQSEHEVRQALPAPSYAETGSAIDPAPAGATCLEYVADLTEQIQAGEEQFLLYRFCFRDDVLLSKEKRYE